MSSPVGLPLAEDSDLSLPHQAGPDLLLPHQAAQTQAVDPECGTRQRAHGWLMDLTAAHTAHPQHNVMSVPFISDIIFSFSLARSFLRPNGVEKIPVSLRLTVQHQLHISQGHRCTKPSRCFFSITWQRLGLKSTRTFTHSLIFCPQSHFLQLSPSTSLCPLPQKKNKPPLSHTHRKASSCPYIKAT